MTGLDTVSIREELVTFFEKIWGKQEGVVKIAVREDASKESFKPYIYDWPLDPNKTLINRVQREIAKDHDVFYSPDMYSEQARITSRTPKDYILGSQWLFIDFDGDAPQNIEWYQEQGVPTPTLIIQSSTPKNQHVYWQLTEFSTNVQEIESARRGLITKLGGDLSGWDAGQYLRIPFSINHKFGKEKSASYDVTIELESNSIYPLNRFPLAESSDVISSVIPRENLPKVHEVLARNTFSLEFQTEFFETVEERVARGGDKSGGYARISHLCIEDGLSDQDIFVLLLDLDKRWRKYAHRTDHAQDTILLRTISRARAQPQHIKASSNVELGIRTRFTVSELLDSNINIEWVFEDLLSTEGHGIIFGPPSVGKTTLSLRLAIACATGGGFLGWRNHKGRPLKTLFYSLEMYSAGVKKFLTNMSDIEDMRLKVGDMLILDILNENIQVENPKYFQFMIDRIKEDAPDIIIFDSMSQMVTQSLINDEATRAVNIFVREVRKAVKCGIILIHHDKKTQERKSQGSLDDMYGGRNLQQDVDFIMSMYPTKDSGIIRSCLVKSRFSPAGTERYLQRTEGSTFEIVDRPTSDKNELDNFREMFGGLADPSSRRDDSSESTGKGPDFSM